MILILGVTASGKSRLAFELAKNLGAEIISIDSMKVYRRMDIGTAKPDAQRREIVKYHMIDIIEPSESFNVGSYYEKANEIIKEIQNRKKEVIAVGGTALYIKALLYGIFEGAGTSESIRNELSERLEKEGAGKLFHELEEVDKVAAQRININDTKRLIRALEVYKLTGKPISSFQRQWETHSENLENDQNPHKWKIIGLRREKEQESIRINKRVKLMIEQGLVDEVTSLLNEEKPLSKQAQCAIGYAEIINYLEGKTDLDKAVELIKKNTRRMAKSQRTWFKTFRDVHWLDIEADESHEDILARTRTILNDIV